MRLHWLQPEDERRDCEFCREHEHYSFRNPDPEKRGRPIVEMGQYRKRGSKDVPQCHLCPKAFGWTPENERIYARWRFWLMGFRGQEIDEPTAWAFFRLEETAREIAAESTAINVNRGIVEAFGHG